MLSRFSSIIRRKDKGDGDDPACPPTRANTAVSTLSQGAPEVSRSRQLAAVDKTFHQSSQHNRNPFTKFSKLKLIQKTPDKPVTFNSEDLYECKDLMRAKYTLDVEVYAMRKTARANIPIREEKQRRANAAMNEILKRVGEWDQDSTWGEEERELVVEIQQRLGVASDVITAEPSEFSFERLSQVS